jgi:hypothetical protein
MRSRRIGRSLIVGVLGVLPLVMSAAPAQAHETWLPLRGSLAYVGPDHTKVVWCDSPYDSMATRVRYYTNDWHMTREAWFTCGERHTDHPITYYCLELIGVAVICRQP